MTALIFFAGAFVLFMIYVIVHEAIRAHRAYPSLEIRSDEDGYEWRVRQFGNTLVGPNRADTHDEAKLLGRDERDRIAALQSKRTDWKKVL